MAAPKKYGLGRRPAADPRDRNYPMRALITPPTRTWRMWTPGVTLNQRDKPHCVGFSWKQWLATSPIRTTGGPAPDVIYHEAQKVDEWPGEGYDGTSVRAGAKVLGTQGRIGEYRWAETADDVRQWILTRGPAVFGTVWLTRMFTPDPDGFVRLQGIVEGGHAYIVTGYSSMRGAFRCVNSWGDWGPQRGRFWLSFEDAAWLLAQDGEACAAVEIAQP